MWSAVIGGFLRDTGLASGVRYCLNAFFLGGNPEDPEVLDPGPDDEVSRGFAFVL